MGITEFAATVDNGSAVYTNSVAKTPHMGVVCKQGLSYSQRGLLVHTFSPLGLAATLNLRYIQISWTPCAKANANYWLPV